MRKVLLLTGVLFLSTYCLRCFAQNDSTTKQHNHRFWINPTQIITGQYSLAYSHNLHGGNNWFEVAIGYRHYPYPPLESYYAPANNLATPKFGVRFTGPQISIATEEFYTKVKKRMSKAAEHDPHLLEMIKNEKPLNSIRYLLQYQYLWHNPACYYAGEENDSYTYSAKMNCISGEVLWSRIIGNDGNHIIWQSYIGIGFHFGLGDETKYVDTSFHSYGDHDLCVHDIHDPNVVTTKATSGYFYPMLQLGIRLGFQ